MKNVYILFFILTYALSFPSLALANHGCFSPFKRFDTDELSRFYESDIIRSSTRNLDSGIKEINLSPQTRHVIKEDESFKAYLENTVEIIYKDVAPFGHINLRVGDEIYSFDYVQRTSQNIFDIERVSSGSVGFVFNSDKRVIDEMRSKIQRFYENSKKYNVPPFDAYAGNLEVVPGTFGKGLKYKSSAPKYGNNQAIDKEVKLIDNDTGVYLLTPTGEKYPLIKDGNKYFMESYSCSSASTCIMDNFLGMKIDADLGKGGAKYLKHYLEQKLSIGFNELTGVFKY